MIRADEMRYIKFGLIMLYSLKFFILEKSYLIRAIPTKNQDRNQNLSPVQYSQNYNRDHQGESIDLVPSLCCC